MKRLITKALSFVICCIIIFAAPSSCLAENFMIRNGITYKMTMDEVKAIEESLGNANAVHETISDLNYWYVTVAGIANSSVRYSFDDEGFLTEVLYEFETHDPKTTIERANAIFLELEADLIEKYGDPLHSSDGEIFPVYTKNFSNFLEMIGHVRSYKLFSYDEWVIEYDDCWLIIDLIFVERGGYTCSIAYKTISHQEMTVVQEMIKEVDANIQNDL